MRIEVGAATDVGRVRDGNEDAFLVREGLFVVADGMGGHLGGEVASSLALEVVERMSERGEGTLAERALEANRAVHERSLLDRTVAGMGTTLTALEVDGARARIAHVGDSRAYRLRDGNLEPLTEDHTLVRDLVRSGEIAPEEERTHPHRNVLRRVLGTERDVEVDEGEVDLRAGDRYLLCSDGLTGMLEDGRIAEVLVETAGDPQGAAARLVELANEAGGTDNVTVVVLDVADA
ncbi:MAG: Stp1/IreP family PP2C-type Ser/Thr phosphatase [Actinomycetota bacterium]